MSEPFIGSILLFCGNFAPRGYALCNGQLLSIAQNTALFSILGTTYGGDGQSTFALPDLRGRVPNHFGQGPGLSDYALGEVGGSEAETMTTSQMPSHSHQLIANAAPGTVTRPDGGVLARAAAANFAPAPDGTAMNPGALSAAGGGQPIPILQPFLTINFCIALEGIFPSRN